MTAKRQEGAKPSKSGEVELTEEELSQAAGGWLEIDIKTKKLGDSKQGSNLSTFQTDD